MSRFPIRRRRWTAPLALFPTLLALAPATLRAQIGPAPGQDGALAFPPDSAVLSILKQRVAEKRSAGIVVGLLNADGTTHVVAWGDPGPGQPKLDGNTVFEIGSISKVFTATALAEMVGKRQVKLDDPVQRYLPASVKMPTRDGKQITLGELSEQNSGLPRMPSNFHPEDPSNPYADYTVGQLYDFLSGYTLPRDPGERFEYSNLGVGLLGHVLALRAGKSYEQLERDLVWTPLGMTHTAITFTPWMKQHLALGHDENGKVVPNWDIPTLAGAGAIRSTADDMLKFLAANLHPERGALEKAMAFAHQERAQTTIPGTGIGLNWLILHRNGRDLVWHNGGTGGYRTFIGMDPAAKMGVVVLTNSGGAGADDIGFHLLDPTIPLAPPPAKPKEYPVVALSAETLARYVGTYELAPSFDLVVTRDGNSLYVQPTGQDKLLIWPYSEKDFFSKEVDAQLTFVTDSSGEVTGLVLHQQGHDAPGKKIN